MRFMPLLALLAAGCASVPERSSRPDPIAVTARPAVLDAAYPDRAVLGRLRYLGGVELESPDRRFGGFSSLKWEGGRLRAVSDMGDWFVMEPLERGLNLIGLRVRDTGDLRGEDGEALNNPDDYDSEALVRDGNGWLVAFEHRHRLLRYPALGAPAQPTGIDPQALFGSLDKNGGVELLAASGNRLFICAERLPTAAAPHCYILGRGGRERVDLPAPPGLDPKAAFPVDADWGRDGTLYILMRSWSGGNDNRGAIVSRSPRGRLRTLATFVRPVTTDNYEGLALRQEAGRTFLYMISDDNFKQYNEPEKPETWQRTLLMKFELVG